MCFYEDGDWTVSVATDETSTAAKPTKCSECRRVIAIGEFVRHIYLQEHEECIRNPTHDDYDGPETDSEECPEGCEHEYGETYDYDRCRTCEQLIEAIHQHEIEEGCAEHESRPMLGCLYDAFSDGDGAAYMAKAEALYPGIAGRLHKDFVRFARPDEDDE